MSELYLYVRQSTLRQVVVFDCDLAKRRYMQVDPHNRLVASTLEAHWNDKLRALDETREGVEQERSAALATLNGPAKQRIRALASDFPSVRNDSATTSLERKRMVALLISDVTLTKHAEHIKLGIRYSCKAIPTPK